MSTEADKGSDGDAATPVSSAPAPSPPTRERRVVGAGSVLFRQGAVGDEAFLIQKGRIELSMKSATGKRIVLGELGRGDIVGELALIGGGARLATATALSDLTLVVVTRADFDRRLDGLDPVMRRVLSSLTDKLKAMSERHVDEAAKIR
jgi:CRP-like cAMP-binding protein